MKRSTILLAAIAALTGALVLLNATPAAAVTGSATRTAVEARVVHLANHARTDGHRCGAVWKRPARTVRWNVKLSTAANRHARQMATLGTFSHIGAGGTTLGDRLRAVGYRYRAAGEVIAAGQRTPEAVVAAWLRSPPHCAVLMNPRYRDVGVAHVLGGRYGTYWVLDLGQRR